MTCGKIAEALYIGKAISLPRLAFRKCQDNCCLVAPCEDRQAEESLVKCLSQGNNKVARVRFESRPCRSQSRCSNHSTTF